MSQAEAETGASSTIDQCPEFAGLDERARETVRAKQPGDDVPMEDLVERYNFRNISDRRVILTRQIIRECITRRGSGSVRIIDIGCGAGMGRNEDYVASLKPWCDELWGVEPDESMDPPEEIFDHTQHALLEDADLPEGHFDIAFSFMVMEHVADPEKFYNALARCLKPGGVYLFMTPNRAHYFSVATRTLKALRIEEFILRIIMGKMTDEYHYPVVYKCNSRTQIERSAKPCGFDKVDIAYIEADGPRPYMKGPLRPLFHLMAWKRTKIRRPDRLLTLFARLTKRTAP